MCELPWLGLDLTGTPHTMGTPELGHPKVILVEGCPWGAPILGCPWGAPVSPHQARQGAGCGKGHRLQVACCTLTYCAAS